jgi:type IV pilus assembly protein PilC
VGVAVIVVMILMIFVIPVFETMFKSAGQTLPLPTLIVLTFSKLVKKYVIVFIPGVILLIYLFKKILSNRKWEDLARPYPSKTACLRAALPKDFSGPVPSNLGNACQQRGSYLGWIDYCFEDLWK